MNDISELAGWLCTKCRIKWQAEKNLIPCFTKTNSGDYASSNENISNLYFFQPLLVLNVIF